MGATKPRVETRRGRALVSWAGCCELTSVLTHLSTNDLADLADSGRYPRPGEIPLLLRCQKAPTTRKNKEKKTEIGEFSSQHLVLLWRVEPSEVSVFRRYRKSLNHVDGEDAL